QRLVIEELADEHVGQQSGGRLAFLDGRGRQRRDAHAALPAAAGVFGPNDFAPDDLGGDVIEAFAALVPDLALGFAAVGADFLLFGWLDAFLHGFQLGRVGLFGLAARLLLLGRVHQHLLGGGWRGRFWKDAEQT